MDCKTFCAQMLESALQSAAMVTELTNKERAAEVKAWVDSHVGPDKRFKSPHQWVLVAGLSAGGMDTIKRGGIPKAPTLSALAQAVGEDPAVVLARAGYIEEPEGVVLSIRERRLLESFRQLAVRDQDAIARVMAGLLRSDGE